MKIEIKRSLLMAAAMLMVVSSIGHAEPAESAAGTVANGLESLIKMPVTILHKISNAADQGSGATSANEDVAVSQVYDQDAETTG